MKIIAIGGEPGSGKSTLMKMIMEHFGEGTFHDDVKLVPYHYWCLNSGVIVLGKYGDDGYAQGTDKMSMAVQPEAIKFLEETNKKESNTIILFEGDRLFNQSFLEHCYNKYDLSIFVLKTSPEIRKSRYEQRGSNQNETWLKGRQKKVETISSNMELRTVMTTLENSTLEQLQINVDTIIAGI